jgi:hypothetical protein
MKVWKVNSIMVNSDVALASELNRLERLGAQIKEVIFLQNCGNNLVYEYQIIYTVEDVMED